MQARGGIRHEPARTQLAILSGCMRVVSMWDSASLDQIGQPFIAIPNRFNVAQRAQCGAVRARFSVERDRSGQEDRPCGTCAFVLSCHRCPSWLGVRWPHAGYFPRRQHLLHRGASVGAGEIDRRADRLRQGQSEALNYAAGNTYALVATAMYATNNGITMHAVPWSRSWPSPRSGSLC
jgi:hypothetical protein